MGRRSKEEIKCFSKIRNGNAGKQLRNNPHTMENFPAKGRKEPYLGQCPAKNGPNRLLLNAQGEGAGLC